MANPLAADLDHVLAHTMPTWEELRGHRLFFTGGTGFIGCWLLETFLWANEKLNLEASAVVLTRDPDAFLRKAPHLATHPDIHLHRGDVRTFNFPPGAFRFLIHAATESSTTLSTDDPLTMVDTIVRGTERALQFARRCGVQKLLFTSSGAVYGRQPPEFSHVPENFVGGPDPTDPNSAYGEAKRVAENLCVLAHQHFGLRTKIARCFAFLGPYLRLDAHFAAGNFLRDGLRGGPIRVQGDGTSYRSYLYAADLAIWLWTILTRGAAGTAYNVGCDRAVTISELAGLVGAHFGVRVRIAREPISGAAAARYVPKVDRARHELGLLTWIPLEDAIARTARWHEDDRYASQKVLAASEANR
jgi:nucleoside-diphosphate-sugar epimerase